MHWKPRIYTNTSNSNPTHRVHFSFPPFDIHSSFLRHVLSFLYLLIWSIAEFIQSPMSITTPAHCGHPLLYAYSLDTASTLDYSSTNQDTLLSMLMSRNPTLGLLSKWVTSSVHLGSPWASLTGIPFSLISAPNSPCWAIFHMNSLCFLFRFRHLTLDFLLYDHLSCPTYASICHVGLSLNVVAFSP